MSEANDKKIVTLNSTSIVTYLECPRKFQYSAERSLALKGGKYEALDKGELMHHLICRWFELRIARDPKPLVTITEELRQLGGRFNSLEKEDLEFLRQRFYAYTMFWADDQARPLVIDGKCAVEIGFSVKIYEDDSFIFILEGRLDRVAEQQGIQFILDHKTQSRKHEYHRRRPQFLNYALGAQLSGLPINKLSVDYIGLQQTINKDTFRRDMFSYSPGVLEEWKEYLIRRVYMPIACDIGFMKELGSCEGTWSPCPFIELCEAPSSRAVEELITLKYEKRERHRSW